MASGITPTESRERLGEPAPTAPGPTGLRLVQALLNRSDRRQLASLVDAWERFGDVIRFRVGNRVVHLIGHPDAVRHVLQSNHRNYTKGRGLEKARALIGDGLLTSEGELWRRQRRLAQPAFHSRRIDGFVPGMAAATSEMLERWRRLSPGRPIDVAAEMMHLTLDIVTRTLFTTALLPGEAGRVAEVMPRLLRIGVRRARALTDLGERLPSPSNRLFARDAGVLDAIVYRIIDERRRSGRSHNDLLGMLMMARDPETGGAMSDRQLRDEVMTIFLAGHETTANNLAWTWYLLSLHPDVRRRVEHDSALVAGGGGVPDPAKLRALEYTNRVIAESLRLYPPAWILQRQAIEDDVVGGYHIPAGSSVLVSPYLIHRRPDLWPNPEGFDPERFTPDLVKQRPLYGYLPFGGGPRLCIGSPFALMEVALVISMVGVHYRLDLAPGQAIEPEASFTLRPRGRMMMSLVGR